MLLFALSSCNPGHPSPSTTIAGLTSGSTNQIRLEMDSFYINSPSLFVTYKLYDWDAQGRLSRTAVWSNANNDTSIGEYSWTSQQVTIHNPRNGNNTIYKLNNHGLWVLDPGDTEIRSYDTDGYLIDDSLPGERITYTISGGNVQTKNHYNNGVATAVTKYTYLTTPDNRDLGLSFWGHRNINLIDFETQNSIQIRHLYGIDARNRVVYEKPDASQSASYIYW